MSERLKITDMVIRSPRLAHKVLYSIYSKDLAEGTESMFTSKHSKIFKDEAEIYEFLNEVQADVHNIENIGFMGIGYKFHVSYWEEE